MIKIEGSVYDWVDKFRGDVFKNIPQDLVTAEHTDTKHFYRYKKTNELFQSTTAPLNIINNPHLKKWAAKLTAEWIVKHWDEFPDKEELVKVATTEHHRIFKDAGEVGTKIHNVVELYCKDWIANHSQPEDVLSFVEEFEEDNRVRAGALAVQRFFNESGAIPVFSELNVALPELKIAGQLDLIILMPAKTKDYWELVLADVKTSNDTTHDIYALQTSVYFYGFKALTGIKLNKIMILGLSKDKPQYKLSFVPHIRTSLSVYKHALAIYNWALSSEKKKVIKQNDMKILKI